MAGLAIEADEVDAFPQNLCPSEVRQALRYIVFELNGFPKWLESMYREWPGEVLDAVLTELLWELENTDPDEPMHYILHDLAVYAPWLHGALAGPLLCWIRSHDLPSDHALDYSLRILRGGELDPSDLVAVAASKAIDQSSDQRAYWYAVWVDVDPETGVDALVAYLDGLDADEGSRAAQLFITTLMGSSRGGRATGPNFGNFHTPGYLKSLYLLMHRHIRVTEDIDRIGGGCIRPACATRRKRRGKDCSICSWRSPAMPPTSRFRSLLRSIPIRGHGRLWKRVPGVAPSRMVIWSDGRRSRSLSSARISRELRKPTGSYSTWQWHALRT